MSSSTVQIARPFDTDCVATTTWSAPPASRVDGPVGIFDSGIGGLSVLRAVRATLPHESLVYFADSRYAPYGQRSETFISARSAAIVEWLRDQGAKAIVVACNTATAQTIERLRALVDVPVVGVEPGLKPALALSRSRRVGVLATAGTLRSARFQALMQRFGDDCQFVCAPGMGLVELIEAGETEGARLNLLLAECLRPMLEAGIDTLVLGCTHYPFIRNAIQTHVGMDVQLIDTGAAVALQLGRRLAENQLAAPVGGHVGELKLASSSDGATLSRIAETLLGLTAGVEQIDLPMPQAE